MSDFHKIDSILPAFVAALDAMTEAHYRDHLPSSYASGWVPKHSLDRGKKFIRVVQGHGDQRSAFCFIDTDGNILKCDGWKRPARGIRGSIFDPNFSIGKGITVYGAVYAR